MAGSNYGIKIRSAPKLESPDFYRACAWFRNGVIRNSVTWFWRLPFSKTLFPVDNQVICKSWLSETLVVVNAAIWLLFFS